MRVCFYCGHIVEFPHKKDAVKCPRCGNRYGYEPVRKLWGRYLK